MDDKQFADLFQIGVTPEMIGIKPEVNVEIKNVSIEVANDIWNAAIEAAACECDGGEYPDRIRKLKK